MMIILAQLFLFLHVVAFIAGGSNGIIQMMTGPQLKAASPETRTVLYGIQDLSEMIGKISLVVVLVTGLCVLWLKWDFTVPNGWFWVKMAGIAGMLVFIVLGGKQTAIARAGGPAAGQAIAAKRLYGKLTSVSFLIVILAAVFAFG